MARYTAKVYVTDESNESGRAKHGKTATIEADNMLEAMAQAASLLSDAGKKVVGKLNRVVFDIEPEGGESGNPFA